LPHEFGGVGNPYFENDLYRLFNIYTPDMDLAIIKPRYTTKNEFKVDLPPNKYLDAQMEDNEDEDGGDLLTPGLRGPMQKRPSSSI